MSGPAPRLGHDGVMPDPAPSPSPPARSRRLPAHGFVAIVVVLALAGVASACSSNGSKSGSTSTTGAPTTTVAGASTTAAPPIPPTTPISIPKSSDGTSPDGSGCTPPSEAKLPDGIWFGVLKSVAPATNTVGLDLACWYTGSAAQAAAGSPSPVPNDYYVKNQSSNVYQIQAVTNVAVVPLATAANGEFTGSLGPTKTGVAAAQTILDSQTPKYVWIEITRGVATVIQAQFTP